MIRLVIFDFDGTLADCREIHYKALNAALAEVDEKYVISEKDHLSIYDGLSTKKKLQLLSDKGFPKDKHDLVFKRKQDLTIEMIEKHLSSDANLICLMQSLKNDGYTLYVASNAIRKTVLLGLEKLGILQYFDHIFSNEDVKNQKPHSEIYIKCMAHASVEPEETIIVEDSKHGRESAIRSKAFVCGVDNPQDLTYNKLYSYMNNSKPSNIKWAGKDVNILIPMAGLGSRFKEQGYKLPKPLINVNGKPMIQVVSENLNIDGNFIFVVQSQHYDEFNLGTLLPLMVPNCKIVKTDGLTQGAACTALLAKEFINNDSHLIIANSDQFVEWDSCDFMHTMISSNVDGGILTFNDTNPKWSFAKLDEQGFVTEVAEKSPISDVATVGIYYYKHGKDFVNYAEQMISKNIRTNNEFYICPVFNEFIQDGKKVKTKNCKKMWGLGVPLDYEIFLQALSDKKVNI